MQALVVDTDLARGALTDISDLEETTERHRVHVPAEVQWFPLSDVGAWLDGRPPTGVLLSVPTGYIGRQHLAVARRLLRAGHGVWFYWSAEQAVERVDDERLRSAWRHWFAVKAWQMARRAGGRDPWPPPPARQTSASISPDVGALIDTAASVPFSERRVPSSAAPLKGTGIYLRTDFWAPISSGGSYVHTCFVAKELARVTDNVVAVMANRYALLDDMGV